MYTGIKTGDHITITNWNFDDATGGHSWGPEMVISETFLEGWWSEWQSEMPEGRILVLLKKPMTDNDIELNSDLTDRIYIAPLDITPYKML